MSTTPGNDGIAAHVRGILAGIGEDPDREGLQKTPERVEKALQFLTAGYQQTVEEAIGGALFVGLGVVLAVSGRLKRRRNGTR